MTDAERELLCRVAKICASLAGISPDASKIRDELRELIKRVDGETTVDVDVSEEPTAGSTPEVEALAREINAIWRDDARYPIVDDCNRAIAEIALRRAATSAEAMRERAADLAEKTWPEAVDLIDAIRALKVEG